MTNIQWLAAYEEVTRIRRKDADLRDRQLKLILDYMELMASIINPEAGKKFMELKELRKKQAELPAERFEEDWEKIKSELPELQIAPQEAPRTALSNLPVLDRKAIGGGGRQLGLVAKKARQEQDGG